MGDTRPNEKYNVVAKTDAGATSAAVAAVLDSLPDAALLLDERARIMLNVAEPDDRLVIIKQVEPVR